MIPKECIEQQRLAKWLDDNDYIFSAIRNESDTRSFFAGKKRVISGVRKGISDFFIFLKNGKSLFLEMKRQRKVLKNGKLGNSPSIVSEEQLKWIEKANNTQGMFGCIAYGFEDAKQKILEYEKINLN